VKTLVLVLTVTLTWLSTSVAIAQWPNATYSDRTWEWEGGARIMDREGSQLNLGLVTDALTNQILFNSNQATDLETSIGFDLRFVRKNCYGLEWELESNYNNWDSLSNITSNNGLASPFFTPITNAILTAVPTATNIQFNSLNYNYESDLFNIELNAKKAIAPGHTLLAGPRFMYLEDNLTVGINGSFANGAVTVPFNQTTRITTENPLFGFQVGHNLHLPITRDIYITSFIKVGVFGNTARSEVFQTNSLQAGTTTFRNRRSQGSFIGETGGKINMDIFPGILSFYAGYEAMWLDNVALGPPQLLGSVNGTFTTVQMTGTPFIHGLVVGGTIRR